MKFLTAIVVKGTVFCINRAQRAPQIFRVGSHQDVSLSGGELGQGVICASGHHLMDKLAVRGKIDVGESIVSQHGLFRYAKGKKKESAEDAGSVFARCAVVEQGQMIFLQLFEPARVLGSCGEGKVTVCLCEPRPSASPGMD